jgi:enamine deaminase RidA (YjgF/YER057c/UK114 family)
MARTYLSPVGLNLAHAANAAYGYGVRCGDFVFISGQVARNEAGETIGIGDFEAQAVQVFENLANVCASAGGTLEDIVDTRMYLVDRAHRPIVNEVRKRFFRGPDYPCSTLLIISGLANPDFLLEIEAIAHIPDR